MNDSLAPRWPVSKKVLRVDSIGLQILKSMPPTLSIVATGVVPTTGWHNGRLIAYVYVQAPPDGIYDFDFVADPPMGPAGQIVLPIVGANTWHDYPQDLKGVRVHASVNKKEQPLSSAQEMKVQPLK